MTRYAAHGRSALAARRSRRRARSAAARPTGVDRRPRDRRHDVGAARRRGDRRSSGTTRGAIADSAGRFVIPAVPPGDVTLRARLLGYKTLERAVAVRAGDTTRVDFALEPEATVLGAVRTEARPVERDAFESRPSVGTVQITARAAEGVPKFAEPDIIRIVQLLPGVEARNDFSTGLERARRRVGSESHPASTAIRSTTRSTSAGCSARSSIRPCATCTLMTGGFPARYGGRLSSVLDVHSAEEVRSGRARHRRGVGARVDGRARRCVRRRQG